MASFNPPVPEFLTADEKKAMVKAKTEFHIANVQTGAGKYGITHTYEIRLVNAKTGEVAVKYLSWSTNPRRQIEADYVERELSSSNSPLGPVRLGAVETDKGNDAWIFESVE
jgi:hypothetical protein